MEYNTTIANLSGQESIKQKILDIISQKDYFIFEIIGNYGTGKQTLCEKIAKIWTSEKKGTILYLKSSYQEMPEDYSTFKTLIMQSSNNEKKLLNIFQETLKDIPGVGNSLSSIVAEIIANKNQNEELSKTYTQNECYIFQKIKKLSQGKNILFICEDFESWDLKSQQVLSNLLEYEKANIGGKIFYILNTTHKIEGLMGPDIEKVYLNEIKPEFIGEVAKQFNPQIQLNSTQIENMYELTRGNLELIKESINLFNSSTQNSIGTFYNIIESQLKKSTSNASNIFQLLREAAFIGKKADACLLKKFSTMESPLYDDSLGEAVNLAYLNEEEDTVSFAKQYIYSVLKEKLYKDRSYYLRLTECINLLYPTRYDLKMQYLRRGNLNHEADKTLLLYLISYFRENNVQYRLNDNAKKRLSQNPYYSFYECICEAYEAYKMKKYEKAQELLSRQYMDIIEFRFEKDYLISLIITNRYYTLEDFSERIDVLSSYTTKEFKYLYPEMYLRALMLLAEFYSETSRNDELKKCLCEIFRCFSKYVSTDKQMQCYEHCFKMKANAFFKIEVATNYTKEAYEYFTRPENIQCYLSKYYLSILNYSANLIVLGDFNKAYELLSEAHNIVKTYPYLKSIHEDILLNNLAISGYHCNHFSAKECVETIETLETPLSEQADTLLIQNNYAIFYALDGNFDKAFSIVSSLFNIIEYNDDIDDYYRYYVLNNYGILLWLKDEREKSTEILNIAFSLNPLPYDQAYFKARADLLNGLLNTILPNELLETNQWNNYLYHNNPNKIGKAWKFWGSLLLFSELQIWSDY